MKPSILPVMKNTDRQIINALRRNGRASISKISRSTGIPVSTVFTKIRDHEKNTISRHVSLIDFQKLGYHHQNLLIKIKSEEKESFTNFIKECKNINNAFEINGDNNFLIETIHKGVKNYFQFKEDLKKNKGIEKIDEYFVMEEIKREGFLEE
jgi:DNA-binding Lrp family transcriptional regulator